MRAVACLVPHVADADERPVPVQVELLGTHVDMLSVAGKYIGQGHGHIQALDPALQVFTGLGIYFIHDEFRNFLAGRGIELKQAHASVQKHGASRGAIDLVVLNQYGPVHRPDRFQLFEVHHAPVHGGRPVAPGESPVLGVQAVDVSVRGTEQHAPPVQGRRRIHPSARGVFPEDIPGRCIESIYGMCVDLRDVHPVARDDRAAQFPSQGCLPPGVKIGWNRIRRIGAPACVVPVGRPVSRSGVVRNFCIVGRPFFQPVPGGFLFQVGFGCMRASEGPETFQFRLQITRAGVRRSIHETVAGHDAVKAPSPGVMIDVPVLSFQIHELEAGA